MNYNSKTQFIAVASIAAELSAIMQVAKDISLAAANAKAIAFRAGEKAKGFQPITDFINELAKETIEKVNEINRKAHLLYRLTVKDYVMSYAYYKCLDVSKQLKDARFEESFQKPFSICEQQMHDCRKEFKTHLMSLLDQLQEIMYPARAARVIASNSRIEASQSGEYLQSLQAVAESVDHAARIIHDNVQRCRATLTTIDIS